MTANNNKSKSEPEVPTWTAPRIEAIPEKWSWKEIGKDSFIMIALISFVKELNSHGEMKHIITAWQVNPNNDKVMSEKQYYFESNSKTVTQAFENRYKDWHKKMEGERIWVHMSSNQQVGLYFVKAE
jgi:hypothetical protein